MKKIRVFSGIKPTGDMTLGNYIGMLKPAMEGQDGKDNVFCVVDLHAITVPQDPETLRKRILDIAKIYLASGLNLDTSVLFIQSHVPEHSELSWIINCYTYFGEANRMIQFKEKYRNKGENVTVGLFDYPMLMAADILLYNTDEVPVGDDQRQHVELCRDIAIRMNKKLGNVFVVPEPKVLPEGDRIMNLTNPKIKMSKSDNNPNGYILLLDKPDLIRTKINKATTDSGKDIRYDPKNKPGISNLLIIMSACTGESIKTLEKKYAKMTYGQFKKDVAEAIIKTLEPIQKKYDALNDEDVKKILSDGAQIVAPIAASTLSRVKEKIGLG